MDKINRKQSRKSHSLLIYLLTTSLVFLFTITNSCLVLATKVSTFHLDNIIEITEINLLGKITDISLDDAETIYSTNNPETENPSPLSQNQFIFPKAENIYVNDYAGILANNTIDKITRNLIQLNNSQGIEMTVLTIKNLNNYGAGPSIEPYATALFNHWGIGNAHHNDGVMILVAVDDRKMRIEIGNGYDKSWDSALKQIIEDEFIPHFKDGNYQKGIEHGVSETIYLFTGSSGLFQSTGRLFKSIWETLRYWWFVIIIPVFLRLILKARNLVRRRPRNCHRCNSKMVLLDEENDDLHLNKSERLEEFLGSVDYFVRHCRQCEHIEIDRYKSWFSRIGACPSCNYVTLESDSTVIRSATTSSTGLKRIDYECKNCDYTDSERVTIAKISESSSSSSGSSSFGGGSSSGGGASGSW